MLEKIKQLKEKRTIENKELIEYDSPEHIKLANCALIWCISNFIRDLSELENSLHQEKPVVNIDKIMADIDMWCDDDGKIYYEVVNSIVRGYLNQEPTPKLETIIEVKYLRWHQDDCGCKWCEEYKNNLI